MEDFLDAKFLRTFYQLWKFAFFFQTNFNELSVIQDFFDKDSLPFGMISMEAIEKAKGILKKIK